MDHNLENTLTKALLAEHKSTRRWKNFRFFVWIILAVVFFFLLHDSNQSDVDVLQNKPYASLIQMAGEIKPSGHFSVETLLPQLNKAFRDKKSEGVVLLINSPGGSPVQASILHDKILQLKKQYHKKVIAVGEDTLASGAYLVAVAADEIFVNRDTITGSIGVIMTGFGFKDAIAKLGVTRRVFTAGNNKDRLDPFENIKPEDKQKMQHILTIVHQNFINDVLASRKNKLSGNANELFSGDFWTGQQAVKLGLVDGTANVWEAMHETFGTTHYRDYSPHPSFWQEVIKDVSMEFQLGLSQSHTHLAATL